MGASDTNIQTAQSAPIALPAVTVEGEGGGQGYKIDEWSSTKATAPLLDTPQTITVIPQQIIKEQGARNLTEVLKNTPGISFQAGENGFATSTNNFSMRGFDASGNIFIDGSRDSGSYSRDVFNIEQVEVVKGPAADNGRGGPGGYVNLVTKTPGLDSFIAGTMSYGFDEYDSEARKRAAIDVNQAIGEHTAVRLNLLVEDSGVPGREVAEKNSLGFAPSVAFGLNTDFRAIFAYERVEQDDLPDWGVPGATISGLDTFNSSTEGASRDAFYGLNSDFDDTTSDSLLARFEYDIANGIGISNQTRWTQVDRDARYTIPNGYAAGTQEATTQTQFYSRVNTTLTNQTNLSLQFDTGPLKHNVATGIELTRERSEADRFGTVNAGNTSIFDPDPGRTGAAPMTPTQTNEISIDTVAVYAYDTMTISPQWEVTGGLRVERYSVEIDSRDVAGAPTGAVDGFEDTETTVGGKLGVVYKPVPNGSIYAAFSAAALPPGSYLSNPDISRTGDNAYPGFVSGADPVMSYNYEVGSKWNFFGDRLATSVALFRTERANVPITGRDEGETVDSFKGTGEQIVHGIELGVAGKITPEWSVFGGLALIDSERKHSANLDDLRKRANPADYGTEDRTSGDELSFTPQVTGNLWTTYRMPFGLTVGGGVQYVGESYLGRPDDANRIIPNGRYGKLPSYFLVHAMANYEVTDDIDLRLNVDNIFDEEHAVSTNWNGSRATLGTPRTVMLSVDFNF